MVSHRVCSNSVHDILIQDDDESGRVRAFLITPGAGAQDPPVLELALDVTVPEHWAETTTEVVDEIAQYIDDDPTGASPKELLKDAWDEVVASRGDEDEDEDED